MGGKKAVEKNREWEKGRRDKLNQSFSELSKLLPDHDPSITLSKMEVLNRAAMYIKTLQRQNQDILNDGKQTFMDDEVDRLQKRVAHLVFKTKLLVDALRNAGVPIPEVKPPKSRNRKKQEPKPPECIENKTAVTTITGDQSGDAEEQLLLPDGVILSDEPLKNSPKPSNNSCTSSSLQALEESLKLTDAVIKPAEGLCRTKDIKISKEPLKEINSAIASVSIGKDVPSLSQAPQPSPISVAVKDQPILTGSLPGVITSINQAQSSTLQNFTFLERSLVNLGPGTLILADGRVVNVPPPMPQIVVKPQPTLILMQKTVRREKRLYPKPKQVDVTRTTFTNKAPIPTIKHINFEFKTKRSRIKVTKTRLSPKQIKKKEPTKSKVVAKSNVLQIDGEIQVEMNETVESIKTTETLSISEIDKNSDEIHVISDEQVNKLEASLVTTSAEFSSHVVEKEITEKVTEKELIPAENSKTIDKLVSKVCQSVSNSEPGDNGLNLNDEFEPAAEENCANLIEQNHFGDDHINELDRVMTTAHDGDKISEELKTFSAVSSVSSIETIADGCPENNQSFENELNIQSSDAFKKRNNISQIQGPNNDFSEKEIAQKNAFTDTSNNTSNHPINDNSLAQNNKNPEVDLNHLSNNDTLQNHNLQTLQNCTPSVPPDKSKRGSIQEQIVLFRDESNICMKNDRNLQSLNSGNLSDLQSLNSGSRSDIQSLNSGNRSDLQSLNSGSRSDLQSLNSGNRSDLQSLNSGSRSDLQSLNSGSRSDLQSLNSGSRSDLQSLNSSSCSDLLSLNSGNRSDLQSLNSGSRSDLQNLNSSSRSDLLSLNSGNRSDLQSLNSGSRSDLQNLNSGSRSDLQSLNSGSRSDLQSLNSGSRSDLQSLNSGSCSDLQSLNSGNLSNLQSLNSGNCSDLHSLNSGNRSDLQSLNSGNRSDLQSLNSGNRSDLPSLNSGNRSDLQSLNSGNRSDLQSLNSGNRSDLQSLNSGNRSATKANQDLLKTPDTSMNCDKQFQNLPSNNHGNIPNLPSNDHGNIPNLPSNDHGNIPNLPSNDHGNIPNLPSNDHGNIPNLPSNNHVNVQSLPSSNHGNVRNLPSDDHGNVKNLPSNNHGNIPNLPSNNHVNVQSLPSSNHGNVRNLPSDDHGNVKNVPSNNHGNVLNLPSYDHSNVKNVPSNNHGNAQNIPSSDNRDIRNKTVNDKRYTVKNVSQEDKSKLQNNSKKFTNPAVLPSNGNNTYFTSPNVVPINEKSREEFYAGQRRIENCRSETFDNQSNVNKMTYNTEATQCNNVMPVDAYNTQSAAMNKTDYNCKDKRLFDGNNQNLNKGVFNAMPSSSSVSNQNLNTQPFVNLNPIQNCRMPRAETYTGNCDLIKDTFNNAGKSPCKEMFVNYLNNPLNKSPYTDQTSLNKESFGNGCDPTKNYFNQSSLNHQAMYANQYNSLNNSFINQNNRVYGKESFPNQCDNFNYGNEKSSSKDTYTCQNRPLNKDLYVSQNRVGYQQSNMLNNKDSCVGPSSTLNKDTYREQNMPLTNQCNVLNKDTYSSNKDCYVGSNQSSNINNSLNKETYNRSVNSSKNVDNNRSNSVSKDTMTNTPVQTSAVNKTAYENQKSLTADKACQPEMPLCRNISSSEFMEVVNQSVMRGNAKNTETGNVQLRSGENRGNIGEIRSAGCSVNNSMYGSNQSVTTFSNSTEHSGNMTFVGSAQKRNKDGVYNNKNNSGIVCKYTIDSLFKNGDINGPQVNIGSTPRDKVPDNTNTCKTHLHKRNTAPYEIEGLPIVNEPSLNHTPSQLYQNESNHYAITSRESGNICSNMIENNMRNEMSLTNTGCNMAQQTDMHNSNNCKTNIGNNEKNNQNNKIYTNTNNDANFNKNDPMLMSSDMLKSKDLDRNNFMPLLDDVRLTTDFSSDLFSSFQVAPGGQHPESMSPTAAFLLAFPLVSTSKTADSINENDNPEHNSSTPTTILQIGNIEQPNPDMFHSQVDSLRSKPVNESNKDFERYAHYDGNMYDNVQSENTKRKSSQSQNFTDQSNNCIDKNYRRNCDTRKRSRNQTELPTYSQSYSYPIFPNNNDFAQFTNPTTDPKTDGVSVPWTMNLNQDFSTQPVQKDVCTTTTKPLKSTERKNSKSDKQQSLKNTSYTCSQQGSQTVDYYVSKPERKKQKTSHSKTPVNWMAPAEPAKNTFVEPPLAQIDVYQNNKEQDGNLLSTNQSQNVYNNIVSSLEVPFDSVCFSDFGNKKSNNYSWSPSKSLLPALDSHNFVIPSTLPTLVGDLALGTSTPAETYKSFEDNRKFEQPKKADKSSSTFLDSAAQTSTSSPTTKKRVEYNPKTQANSNTFLSVSQLVDPKSQKQSKMNEMKNIKRNESNANKEKFQNCQNINTRREQEQNCIYSNRNEIPNNCWTDKQQKNQYKGNYSAESLIAAQPAPETPDAFHLNFNNYQTQSNYFHGDFTENNQLQQSGQQYQNYFNQSASHFPTFLGEEYTHEFTSSGSQRKKKTKENSAVYPPTIHSKDTFPPLQKDNTSYLNTLSKDTGSYQASGLLSQGYRNCIKIGVPPHVGQHTNTTSTLTNFNLSTIFPEMNDQRISGGSSQAPHINPNFSSLPLHNYPPH